jgi:uncharacterized membrane protein YfcA
MLIYLSLFAILMSSMVYGVIGFGDALVLLPIITPLIGIKNAVILVNLWGLLTSFLNFVKYRQFLDRGYFFRFISLGIPATIFGTFLFIEIGLEWIDLMLGIFIFGYSVQKLYHYVRKSETVDVIKQLNTTAPLILAGGFTYGILTSLISAAGPVNVAMLEKTGHYRENFIENFAIIAFTLSVARTPFYFITGLFPYELTILFLLGFPVIFLGIKLGHKLTPKISVKTFQILIFCFLIGISLKTIITSVMALIL